MFRHFALDSGALQEALVDSRERFVASLGPFLERRSSAVRNVRVAYARPPAKIGAWLEAQSFFSQTNLCDHVLVSADVDVDVDQLLAINKKKRLNAKFTSYCAALTLSEGVEDALFLSELTFPGCITVLEGLATAKGSSQSIGKKSAFTSLHLPEENEPNWPDLPKLDPMATLTWATGVGFGSESFGSSRVARSLAALTHAVDLGHHREGEVLFRAMQGLEAFYCDGIGDLRRQLAEKVRVWIGPWSDKRNIIGRLYDIRSAFIHGSTNIEYVNHHRNAWAESEQAKIQHASSCLFAVRLLIRTLQCCTEKNVGDVTWTYSVDEHI